MLTSDEISCAECKTCTDAYLDRELEKEKADLVFAHVRECSACAAHYRKAEVSAVALCVVKEIQYLSHAQVAVVAKMPLDTVKARISRGRRLLKEILRTHAYET